MARLNRGQTMAVFVSIIVVALLVMVWRWTAEEEMSDAGEIELLVDTVGRQTLRDELTLNGELRRDELQTITVSYTHLTLPTNREV